MLKDFIVLTFLLGISHGCGNLTGEWINKKGSVIKIHQKNNHIHGHFDSAVEVAEGTAGNSPAHLRGFINDGLLTFSVQWPTSVGSFVGQCYMKGNNKILQVSWLLKEKAENCDDHWMTTRVGEDRFVPKSNSLSAHRVPGAQ